MKERIGIICVIRFLNALEQQLISNLEMRWTHHPFLTEVFRLGDSNSHPSCFTLTLTLPSFDEACRITSPAIVHLYLEILSIKIMNRINNN